MGPMNISLVELELARTDWSTVLEASGFATHLPTAIRALLASPEPADVEAPYWDLENHVVVQGQLFEAAALVVPVLIAALLEERPRHIRIAVLELLFQIVNGQPHEEEIKRRNLDLTETCRMRAREGLWILYRELVHGERAAAKEVLEVIDVDRSRLMHFLESTST
jgi:hypothetical protein